MNFVIHNHFIDKLALLNGLVSGVALYPQVYSVIINNSVSGLSIVTFIVIFINSIIWFFYAIHRSLFSLGLASILNSIASGILILLIAL